MTDSCSLFFFCIRRQFISLSFFFRLLFYSKWYCIERRPRLFFDLRTIAKNDMKCDYFKLEKRFILENKHMFPFLSNLFGNSIVALCRVLSFICFDIYINKKTTAHFIYRREQELLPWDTLTPRIPTSKPRLQYTIIPSLNVCGGLRTLRMLARTRRLVSWLPPTMRTLYDSQSRRWKKLESLRRTKWSVLGNFSPCAIILPSPLVSYLYHSICAKINVVSNNYYVLLQANPVTRHTNTSRTDL